MQILSLINRISEYQNTRQILASYCHGFLNICFDFLELKLAQKNSGKKTKPIVLMLNKNV